jgi:hypothetical protein
MHAHDPQHQQAAAARHRAARPGAAKAAPEPVTPERLGPDAAGPDSPSVEDVLALQRSAGNAKRGLQTVTPVMFVGNADHDIHDLLNVNECIEVARKVTGSDLGHVLLAPEHEGGERVSYPQRPNNPEGLAAYPRLVTRPGMTPQRLADNLTKETEYFRFTWQAATIDVDVDKPWTTSARIG